MYATSAKKREVRAEVRGRGDKTEEESREERYGRGDPQGRREHKDVLAGSVDFSARRKKKMGSECETWPESKCHPAAGETGSVLAVKMTCSSFIGPRTLHRLWIALSSVRLCYRVISPAFPFKRHVSVDSVFPYKICHEQWNHRFVLVVKKKSNFIILYQYNRVLWRWRSFAQKLPSTWFPWQKKPISFWIHAENNPCDGRTLMIFTCLVQQGALDYQIYVFGNKLMQTPEEKKANVSA